MKRFKVLDILVLILLLCISGCSHRQEKTGNEKKADDLLIKAVESLHNQDIEKMSNCFLEAVKLDSTKIRYIAVLACIKFEEYEGALKLLEQRKDQSPGERELKVIQILTADVHIRWSDELKKRNLFVDAIMHLDVAYGIDIIYRPKRAAVDLNNIGFSYSFLGQNHKAMECFEKALKINKSIGSRSDEATTLSNIGLVYYTIGQNKKAVEYFERALQIIREVGDRSREAGTLNNIGGAYSALGQKQEAMDYFEIALPILREIGDRPGEATTLNNIGLIYDFFGQKHKALEYFKKVLSISREMGDRFIEASILNNIGGLYSDLGQNRKALEYHEEALQITRKIGNCSIEATSLNSIGVIYSDFGQKKKALEYYEKALAIHRQVGDRSGEATTLNNIGLNYGSLGKKHKELEYLEEALSIFQELGDKEHLVDLLCNLLGTWFDMNKNSLAIFYGKKVVNTIQNLRKSIHKMDLKTKLKYLVISEDYYRITASLLMFSGRLGEAQQVLDILKDEEYFSFVRKDQSAYIPKYAPIDYTVFERKWIDRQNTIVKKMSSISSPYYELFLKSNKTPEEEKELGVLKRELEKVREEYSEFLARMKKDFLSYEIPQAKDIAVLTLQSYDLQEYLKSLDRDSIERTVALQFLVFKGRISVIIITPTSQMVKQSSSFNDKKFNTMIYDYRDLIEKLARLSIKANFFSKAALKIDKLSRQKRVLENKLYRIIFQPVHQYLKQYGAVNLLVSLDGVLRYIPLGSLWDGEHYLVQQYRIVRFTPSSLKHIYEKPVIENKILGMGASKGGKGFIPLPHAGLEIRAIVNDREKSCTGLIDGNALIDNDFTRETMIGKLKTLSYPLVHIASHFKFSPGDETNNQLLLGDGTIMNLSDIRKEKDGKLFNNVRLLVLSACQTGMGGNGEEIDGFARLAQQCGAGSVIASLWSVDDESTKELMVKFYRILEEGKVTSKIEALRQAQLELAGLDDLINESKSIAAPSKSSGKKSDYSNPYYWAPFIMMGNWR